MITVDVDLNEEEVLSALHDLDPMQAKLVVRDWLNGCTEQELAGIVTEVLRELWDEVSAQKCADLISKWKEEQ